MPLNKWVYNITAGPGFGLLLACAGGFKYLGNE